MVRLVLSAIALLILTASSRADDLETLLGLEKQFRTESAAGHYRAAEPIGREMLAVAERSFADKPEWIAKCLNNLGNLLHDQAKYIEAEPFHRRALTFREETLGPDHSDVAQSLNNLALSCDAQGRYAEAEPLFRRALAIYQKALGTEHPMVAACFNNLGRVYNAQGRYAEAEPLFRHALAIYENDKRVGRDHPVVADCLSNLAGAYHAQGRYTDAQPLEQRALAIREKALDPKHPSVAISLHSLANVLRAEGRYAEAEPLLARALTIREEALGPEHPKVASILQSLALVDYLQGHYAEAEPLARRALALWEKALGPEHPNLAQCLAALAALYHEQGKDDEAQPLLDRAIAIDDRSGVSPGLRFHDYHLRARIAWHAGRRDGALEDLRHALDLAEQQRGNTSGAEHERAETFGTYAGAFERMVTWQAELGRSKPGAVGVNGAGAGASVDEGFQTIEKAHARALLEQMDLQGVDLLEGVSASAATTLRQRESDARVRIGAIEKRLDLLDRRTGAAARSAAVKEQRRSLQDELVEARALYLEAYREIRNNSPAYRLAVGKDRRPVGFDALGPALDRDGALLLEYFLGDQKGFVLVAGPGGTRRRIEPLTVKPEQARVLEITPGPLNAARLHDVLSRTGGGGVFQQLAETRTGAPAVAALAVLWQVLVPAPERQALLGGRCQTLWVIPDGPLALLPFETLVVEAGEVPRFLLDAGPPIAYGPSATILYNLAARPAAGAGLREPVLALGDPAYSGSTSGAGGNSPALLTSRSRSGGSGARLPALPFSGREVQWVARSFQEGGVKAGVLTGATATEAGLRHWAPGRRVVHLACHGLSDQNFGNFFGALALTPGPKGSADPADDGFLTLPEIYALDLKGCELAILSACQTNYGPQQKGEGTWALSRGFLVAGSRRVVASNWLVNDEAAASLVRVFCARLAQAEKQGKPIDHAQALQDAKRWVRDQDKWRSPYYWASMVLIGPK